MKNSKQKTHSKNSAVPKVPSEFSSMAQASAYLGIPKSTLRLASKSGADAFRNGRVQTLALIRWIFDQPENTEGIDWSLVLKRAQAEREKLKLSRERGETADKSVIKFGLNKVISQFFSALSRQDTIELPASLKGLDEIGIQTELVAKHSRLKEEMRSGFQRLAEAQATEKED